MVRVADEISRGVRIVQNAETLKVLPKWRAEILSKMADRGWVEFHAGRNESSPSILHWKFRPTVDCQENYKWHGGDWDDGQPLLSLQGETSVGKTPSGVSAVVFPRTERGVDGASYEREATINSRLIHFLSFGRYRFRSCRSPMFEWNEKIGGQVRGACRRNLIYNFPCSHPFLTCQNVAKPTIHSDTPRFLTRSQCNYVGQVPSRRALS